MAALGRIDVAYEGVAGIGAKPGVDGAGFYQADVHAAALELEVTEIADRLNEITFGGALMAEMRAIAFVPATPPPTGCD